MDVVLTEEVLNQLEIEDTLASDFCQLSLNALSGAEKGDAMKLRALVHNKVMLILIDSGSSHSFISSAFVDKLGLPTKYIKPQQVRLANGDTLTTGKMVPQLAWWDVFTCLLLNCFSTWFEDCTLITYIYYDIWMKIIIVS